MLTGSKFKDEEKPYLHLLDSIPHPVITLANGEILYINERFRNEIGLPGADLQKEFVKLEASEHEEREIYISSKGNNFRWYLVRSSSFEGAARVCHTFTLTDIDSLKKNRRLTSSSIDSGLSFFRLKTMASAYLVQLSLRCNLFAISVSLMQ